MALLNHSILLKLVIVAISLPYSTAEYNGHLTKCSITKEHNFKDLVLFQITTLFDIFVPEHNREFKSTPCLLEYPGNHQECSDNKIQELGTATHLLQSSIVKLMVSSRNLTTKDFEDHKIHFITATFSYIISELQQILIKDDRGCFYELEAELLQDASETAIRHLRSHRSCGLAKSSSVTTTPSPSQTLFTRRRVRRLYPECRDESDLHINRLVDFFKTFNPSKQPPAILQQAYNALLDAIKSSPYPCTQDYVQLAYKVHALELNATSLIDKRRWTLLKQRFNPKIFDLFAAQKRWALFSVEKPGYALYATSERFSRATSWRYATFKKLVKHAGMDEQERNRFAWQITPQDQHSQYAQSGTSPPPDGGSLFDFRSANGSYFFGRYLTSFEERLSPMLLPTEESMESGNFTFKIFFNDKVLRLVGGQEAGSFVPDRLKGPEFMAIKDILKDLAGRDLRGTSTFYLQEIV